MAGCYGVLRVYEIVIYRRGRGKGIHHVGREIQYLEIVTLMGGSPGTGAGVGADYRTSRWRLMVVRDCSNNDVIYHQIEPSQTLRDSTILNHKMQNSNCESTILV